MLELLVSGEEEGGGGVIKTILRGVFVARMHLACPLQCQFRSGCQEPAAYNLQGMLTAANCIV